MGVQEHQPLPGKQSNVEILNPDHFYAAYVFDKAKERENDIQPLIEQVHELGYPVRYWWLSDAMDLQDSPDRLVVCVHHPSASEDAGMDLYEALKTKNTSWDDLDAAAVEEYRVFGKPLGALADLHLPSGVSLFPQAIATQEIPPKQCKVLFQITQDDVREEAEERLGRKLSNEEFPVVLNYFRKALEYLDWRPYLDEALRWCEDSGLIKPGEDEFIEEG